CSGASAGNSVDRPRVSDSREDLPAFVASDPRDQAHSQNPSEQHCRFCKGVEVSTASLSPRQKSPSAEWARLIPGEMPMVNNPGKKRPQSVKLLPIQRGDLDGAAQSGTSREDSLGLLVPRPLQSRVGLRWLWSMAGDFALVGLSWLVMGALVMAMRAAPPSVRWFEIELATASLLGIAVLHAALITLLGYTEGLHLQALSLRRQAQILGKSVLWATMVLCFAYLLQGAPWSTNALFCGAGVLGFGALWGWRWWNRERGRSVRKRSDSRNVLIVGAGDVGRRVGAHIEANCT